MSALVENQTVMDRGTNFLIGVSLDVSAEKRAILEALAHADGFETISQWFEWRLGDYEETPEELLKSVRGWLSADRMEIVVEILDTAGLCEYTVFPWSDWPKGTEMEFRTRLDEWTVGPTERITAEEEGWMREMAKAALALDGKAARDLGERILQSRGLLD